MARTITVIVSDTSPIRALHHLDLLNLLPNLFNPIMIPPAVRDELLRPTRRFHPFDPLTIPTTLLRTPTNGQLVQRLLAELQRSEAEAIALAHELHVQLLIDEMEGRKIAARLGLQYTGVFGVLVEAKSRNLIPTVTPLLHRLRDELGFFLSTKFIDRIRNDVNE